MCDLVVIGASAGGVRPLLELVRLLPADFPAAVLVAVHTLPHRRSALPDLLARTGNLPVLPAADGDAIEPGRIYVSQPDQHLLVEDGSIRLSRGARENGYRPSIDVLFRTAAHAYGPRAAGVILSGMLADGTAGLRHIHDNGGLTIVQHPNEAGSGDMPLNAIRSLEVDHCAPIVEIAGILMRSVGPSDQGRPVRSQSQQSGKLMPFRCPACAGPLSEIEDGHEYRCMVGHNFSREGLLTAYIDAVENSLWTTVAVLREQATVLRRLAEREPAEGSDTMLLARADESERHATSIEGLLHSRVQTER